MVSRMWPCLDDPYHGHVGGAQRPNERDAEDEAPREGNQMNQVAMISSTMQLTQRLRNLALAAAASVAILAIPATQAHAADNAPVDPDVRCAAKLGPGEYEFYLPGAKVTDKDGNKWVCGPDGQWFRDYSAAIKTPTITLGTTFRAPFTNLTFQVR
jgi:hypothetical protein